MKKTARPVERKKDKVLEEIGKETIECYESTIVNAEMP